MPSRSIVDRLKDGELLLMDGATGSEIQRRGVNVNKGSNDEQFGVWSASANIDAPGVVRAIHEDYLRAGADIIISNNFYTTSEKLKTIGAEDEWELYTRRGGELAVDTRDKVNPEAYVGGGVSPPGTGDLRSQYEDQARVLAAAGVDFMLPEYVGGGVRHEGGIADCITAVEAFATAGLPVFLGISNLLETGTMRDGESMEDLGKALNDTQVAGVFLMCSYPECISAGLPALRDSYEGPLGAYGHLGYDRNPDFGKDPEEPYFKIEERHYNTVRYAQFGQEWIDMGAQVIGGCCSTRPDHIETLRPVVKAA